jgi:hypothetical protein
MHYQHNALYEFLIVTTIGNFMAAHTPQHRVYLLTVWQEHGQPNDQARWRFRLEDLRTGQRRGFTGTTALVGALLKEWDDDDTSPEDAVEGAAAGEEDG